jgi:peptidoglycan/xylan/chitin deacetylase (PgdA/CDA1 family)
VQALPVLTYHHVSPNTGLVTISPEVFRSQIEHLANNSWKTIKTHHLEAFYAGHPLPPKSLLITFDDGYLDNFMHAHPVLEAYGMNAVNFIVTGWINDGPVRSVREGGQECPNHNECKRRISTGDSDSVIVRWSEIEVMQAAGTFEFHAHTHTHTRWDQQIPDSAARCDALASDLAQLQATFRERLGTTSRHLCWPQGYFQQEYLPVAREAGFHYLYTTQPTVNALSGDTEHIGRINVRDKTNAWVTQRACVYGSTVLGKTYNWLKGLPA